MPVPPGSAGSKQDVSIAAYGLRSSIERFGSQLTTARPSVAIALVTTEAPVENGPVDAFDRIVPEGVDLPARGGEAPPRRARAALAGSHAPRECKPALSNHRLIPRHANSRQTATAFYTSAQRLSSYRSTALTWNRDE